jgi:hypothetical protein
MRKFIVMVALFAATWPIAGRSQQPHERSSLVSAVQLEKLNKLIEKKGANFGLNGAILTALGLGDGTPLGMRNLTIFDVNTQRHYTFGIVTGTGRYIATISDGSSPRIFLLDENLRVLAGLKTNFGLERMTQHDAEAGAHETLEQFSSYGDMN